MADDDHLYRRGVGVMLLNSEGKVFVGARIDNTDDAWQMPQGGASTRAKSPGRPRYASSKRKLGSRLALSSG